MAPTSTARAPTSFGSEIGQLITGSRDLWLIYLATFLEYLGIFSFLQTLPLWLSEDHGMSDQTAGWWAAGFSLLVTFLAFFAGAFADSFGVQRLLVGAFVLAAVTRLGMSLAGTATGAILWMMAFAAAYATASPTLQVAVNATARPELRAFAFSLWYVSFNLSAVVAGPMIDWTRRQFLDERGRLAAIPMNLPLVGARTVSAHDVILAAGFLSATIALLVVLFLRAGFDRDDAPAKKSNPLTAVREVVADRTFWRFMVMLGLMALVKLIFQHMHFTWPKYVTRVEGDAFPVGSVWSLNALAIIVLAPLATALTRHAAIFPTLLAGATISALSPFVLCLGSSLWHQIAMIVLLTIGEAIWSPRLYEYNIAMAPRGREATYVGLAALPFFLAKFLVAPMSGLLLARYCPPDGAREPAMLWAIVGATTIIGPLGMWLLRGWLTEKRLADG